MLSKEVHEKVIFKISDIIVSMILVQISGHDPIFCKWAAEFIIGLQLEEDPLMHCPPWKLYARFIDAHPLDFQYNVTFETKARMLLMGAAYNAFKAAESEDAEESVKLITEVLRDLDLLQEQIKEEYYYKASQE